MREVIYLLMLLSTLGFWLHISLLPQKGLSVLSSLALAIFAYWFYPYAIQQNSQTVSAYLHSPEIAQGLAIFLIAEGMLLLTSGLLQLRKLHGEPIGKGQQRSFYLVGPSVLPAIALLETLVFFQGLDMSFTALALSIAAGIFLLFAAVPILIRRILPEKDLRLELKLLLHFLQIVTACLLTAGFDIPVPSRESHFPDLKPLVMTLALTLSLGILGYLGHQIKKNKWKY
ncbi:hypothetical protein [Leadbetterella sp. DM7]|uniref:hypothetical protein n=1 Tax=Leadbetterella sp. DM7 TaxID=3235085 RepID=UPI00349EC578